jgi:hypothetical protein
MIGWTSAGGARHGNAGSVREADDLTPRYLKFRKSGGGWSLRVGINKPS